MKTSELNRLYRIYLQGYSVLELAEIFGPSWWSIWNGFRRLGLKLRSPSCGKKRIPDSYVAEMYAAYSGGMSLGAVGRKYRRGSGTCVREIFSRRGFSIRPYKTPPYNPKNGQILPFVPKTPKQIDAIIARMKRVNVPVELKQEWRHWPLKRRSDFIRQVRRHLGRTRNDPPTTPLSPDVEPFDYSSERAHSLMRKANKGLPSRAWKVRLFPCSQGVIYDGQLWFWVPDTGYCRGIWRPDDKRPVLHHVIWSKCHGRKVPPGGVIRFVDRNPNNFSPNNLTLLTQNDVCRENQAKALTEKSRERAALLLQRSQRKEKHGLIEELQRAA